MAGELKYLKKKKKEERKTHADLRLIEPIIKGSL